MSAIHNPILCGLPDACAEAFGLAIRLRAADTVDDAHELRGRITSALQRLEDRARRHDVDREAVDQARFALVALLDEIVMTSQWPVQAEWAREPLQLSMFSTTNAGEEFFERIEHNRRGSHPDRTAIVEVFATCIALGFRGRYGTMEGIERLRGVLANTLDAARGTRDTPRELSPAWEPERAASGAVRRWPAWIFPVAAAAVVLLCVAIADSDLSAKLTALTETLSD